MLLVCGILMVRAEGYKVLRVHLNDGSKTEVILSNTLTVKFDNTHLIATDGDNSVSVERSSIVRLEHDTESGVEQINALDFSGIAEGSEISVYNASGICVYQTIASGNFHLSLDDLAPGTYIVKVNRKSYKVAIK